MLYRVGNREDFASLYAIEEACFKPPLRFSRGYLRRLIQQPNAATWIAADDLRMCGFGIVEWTREPVGTVAYIQTLEVIAEARGQGIGSTLLLHMEEAARRAGAVTIWLHVDAENAAAIRLYQAHGYEYEDREEDYYGAGRAALIFVKNFESQIQDRALPI